MQVKYLRCTFAHVFYLITAIQAKGTLAAQGGARTGLRHWMEVMLICKLNMHEFMMSAGRWQLNLVSL